MHGHTLAEFLVASAIGLFVVACAGALFIGGRQSYLVQAEEARVVDAGRQSLDHLARLIRQARPGDLRGRDGATMPYAEPDIALAVGHANGSDVLAFAIADGDGVADCTGASPAHALGGTIRGVLYVAPDAAGEPELRCTYRGAHAWSGDALVRGVESLQFLYGVDADGDGAPERFIRAADVATGEWDRVVAVRIALLMRGAQALPAFAPARYALFGGAYAAAGDAGAVVDTAGLPRRTRRVFAQTVGLRGVRELQ
jgi:type IV pilus assembly protein PilW